MDLIDRALVNRLQRGIPVAERPFAGIAEELDLDEDEVVERLRALLAQGVLSRFGPMYDAERLGGGLSLAALAVPPARFDEVTALVNGHPEVAHNYERDHRLNMWFVVAAGRPERVSEVLDEIEAETGLDVLRLPKTREYFLELRLEA
jgi:DNA-binding Lrp family transcriptional regulator